MGVLGLSKLIGDEAAHAIKEQDVKAYFGRRIAIDASMSLYQFLIAIRYSANPLMNEAGETTSHINGFFYRTCRMLENGIKPVYVFDGKPPSMKTDVLSKRRERQSDAIKALKDLEEGEAGTAEEEKEKAIEAEKLQKKTIRVTKKHMEDVKSLLKLMGVPTVDAPSEAEAQCAQLCKEGLTYGVATEDMDALTFGAPKMIRHLSQNTNDRIREIDLASVLKGFDLTQDQFIDLCILMGCDYCPSIRGIGPKKGLELIRQYKSIEKILTEKFGITQYEENGKNGDSGDVKMESGEVKKEEEDSKEELNDTNELIEEMVDLMDASSDECEEVEEEEKDEKPSPEKKSKKENVSKNSSKKGKKGPKGPNVDDVPKDWQFQAARKLFQKPEVLEGTIKDNDLKIRDVDEAGLIKFLCEENQFEEERIRAAIRRINGAKGKASQTRIDSFFKAAPNPNSPKKQKVADNKTKKTPKASGRGRKPK